ncbi:hypothetical protein [Actinomadura macrotermitis]|uniref:Uncharacterized protein n=1 Tax=Actinomadura macrotermitis TaxID=2585200 RepID=A0A7K0BRY2_9ACTN|nr:hypothetical protein [Actinomadura macrotermitis]MQY03953.1 hypothetical protein [Actinomadura macrotermitis]
MNIGTKRLAAVAATTGLGVAAATAVAALSGPDERKAAPVGATERAWRLVPAATGTGYIGGLAATPGGGMWAAGELSGPGKPLVERLTVQGWTRVALPAALSTIRPNGIGASAANNVWVTGPRSDSGVERVLQWNGTKWRAHDLAPSFMADGVLTFGPKDTWVHGLGKDHARHWNGTAWRDHALGLFPRAISGIGSRDLWAVGFDRQRAEPAVAHWNGTSWRRLPLPKIPNLARGEVAPALRDVVALSGRNVWAVGTVYVTDKGRTVSRALLAHWNGTAWKTALGANGTGYTDVEADGAGGIWTAYGTLLRHRTEAGAWSRTTLPVPAGKKAVVHDLAHRPGTRTLWAGGYLSPGRNGSSDAAYWRND